MSVQQPPTPEATPAQGMTTFSQTSGAVPNTVIVRIVYIISCGAEIIAVLIILLQPVVITDPPKYDYIPNDFMAFSLFTVIVCCIFFPPTLCLSTPALLNSMQSKKNIKIGAVEVARKQGLVAAYLNIAAIVAALVVACVVTGLALGLSERVCYGYRYYWTYC